LARIERRLSVIERRLELGPDEPQEPPLPATPPEDAEHRQEELENRIGENWFPKVGITVLIIGVAFLLTFPLPGVPSVLPSLLGYLIAGAALGLAYRWRSSLPEISGYVQGGALVLLYFTTLRLHFFSTDPITDNTIEFVLLPWLSLS
jgi:hypothetical protein